MFGGYDNIKNSPVKSVFVSKFDQNLTYLAFTTFLEGSTADILNDSYGCEVRVDSSDNIVVASVTYSSTFPVTDLAYDRDLSGARDVVITKLNSIGNQLLFSTYLGGSNQEVFTDTFLYTSNPIALGSDDSIYIAMNTDSTDFPLTSGSYSHSGPNAGGWSNHLALCHLSADGSTLLASTYFGGSSLEYRPSIALDNQDNVYLTACTLSTDLPVTADVYKSSITPGKQCIFVTELNASLTDVLFSTYLIEANFAYNALVNIGPQNSLYITMTLQWTNVISSPVFPSGFQNQAMNVVTPVVMRIKDNGTQLLYGSYLDANLNEVALDADVDSSGFLWVMGFSQSWNFPITIDAFYGHFANYDIFVSRFTPDLSHLSFSTCLIGSNDEFGTDILINEQNRVYVAGYSTSNDYVVLQVSGFDLTPHIGTTGCICVFTPPIGFPYAPSLTAVPSPGKFTFSWNEPSPNSFPIGGYALYRTISNVPFSISPWKTILGRSSLITEDSFLPPADSYHYAIRAFDTMGNLSDFSNVIDYYVPAKPSYCTTTSTDKLINVSWTHSIPGTAPVTTYKILRSEQSNFSSSTVIGSVSFPRNYYIDSSVEVNKAYYYRIQALDMNQFQSKLSNICTGMAIITYPILVLSFDSLKKEYTDDDFINFKVYIHNQGGAIATGVVLSMVLPDVVGFNTVEGGALLAQNDQQLTFSISDIAINDFITINFICQIKGKITKEEKQSILLFTTSNELVSDETQMDFIVKVKKNNNASISVNVTVTNLQQDPVTGKRYIGMGQPLIVQYSVSGGAPPYNLYINWGDGNSSALILDKHSNLSGQLKHIYDTRGTVRVSIKLEDSSGQSKESNFDIEIR